MKRVCGLKMNKRNLLLIMPNFYEYSTEIVKEFEEQGNCVDLFFEEPSRNVFLTIRKIQKLLKFDLFAVFNRLLLKKIRNKNKHYDVFVVIRGNILNEWFVNEVKRNFLSSDAKTIYYTWDSFEYLYHKGKLGSLFKKKMSFDSLDVKNNPEWQLLPLFYTDKFSSECHDNKDSYKYDCSCIASFNVYRYLFIKDFVNKNPDLRVCVKLYIDRSLFNYKLKHDDIFKSIDRNYIIFEPLEYSQLIEIYDNSRCVLDVTHEHQVGLSMRTIETIGLNKKLITNNKYVRDYGFYLKENICVIDDSNKLVDNKWLLTSHICENINKEKYSLKNWIYTILE